MSNYSDASGKSNFMTEVIKISRELLQVSLEIKALLSREVKSYDLVPLLDEELISLEADAHERRDFDLLKKIREEFNSRGLFLETGHVIPSIDISEKVINQKLSEPSKRLPRKGK